MPDKSLSILEGAIQASGWNNIRGDGISRMYFDALAKKYHFSLTDPWETLPEDVRSIILYGTGGEKLELHYDQPRGKGVLYQPFEGICNNVERRYKETQSDASKRELEELMAECPCPTCKGKRLKKESLAVTVGDKDIDALTRMSVVDELQWVDRLELTHQQHLIADRILKEIKSATFMSAAAATGGEIGLLGARAGDIRAVIPIFEQMGCQVFLYEDRIFIKAPKQLKAVRTVRTMPYPGFPTDAQAIVTAALAKAKGTSVVVENIFENRYRHVDELVRMGADRQPWPEAIISWIILLQ